MDILKIYLLCTIAFIAGFFLAAIFSVNKVKEAESSSLLSTVPPKLVPSPRSTAIQSVEDVKIIDTATWRSEVVQKIEGVDFKVKSHPDDVKIINNGSSIVIWSRWEKDVRP